MRKLLISLVMVLATLNAQAQEKTMVTVTDTCKVKTAKGGIQQKAKVKKLSKKEKKDLLKKSTKTAGYVEASAEDKHKDSIAGATNLKLY